ncbi:hypothetical protein Syun_030749 [Stephania yunnanensis]|uniref:Protein kinase domain-containing protein n=1 Tax=Stephania yunnanensis TaxID=152371 RepID=A0AAP0HER7_9MAGN
MFGNLGDGVDEEGEEDDGGEEDEKGLGNHRISGAAENTWYSRASSDLLRASAEVLGKGSVGTSYKAVLEEGTTVVVKRLKDVVVTKREFEVQMEGLRKVNHENIIPLRAFYYSKDEKLLVYDFMPPEASLLFFTVRTRERIVSEEEERKEHLVSRDLWSGFAPSLGVLWDPKEDLGPFDLLIEFRMVIRIVIA